MAPPLSPGEGTAVRVPVLGRLRDGLGDRVPGLEAAPGEGERGTIVLADEVLTPDSSRYWPADDWQPGRTQASFDKQVVRNWLTSDASGWDRTADAEPPPLPAEVVALTRARYVEAYERLTGERF